MPIACPPRDPELTVIEAQVRIAIRDAVNRSSRKPFQWGGLAGYQQLAAIGQALHRVSFTEAETQYLHGLTVQVDRVLEMNRALAQDLQEARTWAERIAGCLRYLPSLRKETASADGMTDRDQVPPTGQQVVQEMEKLQRSFAPDLKRQPAQAALYGTWQRLWRVWSPELVYCYDIPGLPQDNLQLEGFFGRLRRHQRRISGCKTTRELRDFGQCQVLFLAESEEDLLQQLRQVPQAEYQAYRRRLAEAEAPRQFLHRLHRDPTVTMRRLVDRHAARRRDLTQDISPP